MHISVHICLASGIGTAVLGFWPLLFYTLPETRWLRQRFRFDRLYAQCTRRTCWSHPGMSRAHDPCVFATTARDCLEGQQRGAVNKTHKFHVQALVVMYGWDYILCTCNGRIFQSAGRKAVSTSCAWHDIYAGQCVTRVK